MKVFYALINRSTNSILNQVELEITHSASDVKKSMKSKAYFFTKGLDLLNITKEDLHTSNISSLLLVQCSHLDTDTLDVTIIPFG